VSNGIPSVQGVYLGVTPQKRHRLQEVTPLATTDKLTDTAVRKAKPRAKPYKLFDGGGLHVLVRPDGKRYWRLKYYVDGVEKLISFGVYPTVTLATARKRRQSAKELVEAGSDPSVQRQQSRAAKRNAADNTFEKVARDWFSKRSKSWAASNATKILSRLERDAFPWLGSSPIADITGPMILETLRRVEQRGAVESAHRIKQYINSIYEFAIETHRARANPTPHSRALATPAKKGYASITNPTGVGALIRAIRGYQGSPITRIALQLAPLLFVRPGELRASEWPELELDDALWRIPAARMKMKSPHLVPLPRQAIALFNEVKVLTGSGRLVFPSERGGGRPMSPNTLNVALRTLGYSKDQMTSHGFRHMASTLLNEHGWNRDAIERQLAHSERNSMRAAYNAAEYLPERKRMMQWWADRLDALADSNNLVTLRGKTA
jgi:integrase